MPTPALLLLIAALLPLASFILLAFIGRRMGNPFSGYVAMAFFTGSWACSVIALVTWFPPGGQHAGTTWGKGDKPIAVNIQWLPVGAGVDQEHPGFLDAGVYVDSLTIAMFNTITLVAAGVTLFSIGYLREEKRYPRFFAYLSLFGFSMLGLLLSSTLLQLFIFWQLTGLCSYLLIGFWHERPAAASAAIKSFITNRLGDVGFLLGMGILFYHLGNTNFLQMAKWLGSAGTIDGVHHLAIHLPNGLTFSSTTLTIMGIALFCGVIAKSAQFPLQTWLADAMEGPAPASALLHGAAMVAAGVYLIGRIFPILTPDAKLFIAIIGATTMTMAAFIAIVQSDIKRVLAYGTVSQLGLMILAMGIGSWVGALFHLIIHAFIKSLLFLGCGSVIRATDRQRDLSAFGGLFRKMPVTAITFGIGVLAISGAPFFAGYFSNGLILNHAGAFATFAAQNHHSKFYWLFFALPAAVMYLTAFYMMRCWMLTFWGKPRDPSVHENASESALIWFPLIGLAGLSIFGGSSLMNVRNIISQSQLETRNYTREEHSPQMPAFSGFDQTWTAETDETHENPLIAAGEKLAHPCTAWAFAVGIAAAFVVYIRGYSVVNLLMRIPPLRWIHHWLYHGMYFDEMYFSVFVVVAMGFSRLAGAVDRYVIDGAVNFAGTSVRRLAGITVWSEKYIVTILIVVMAAAIAVGLL